MENSNDRMPQNPGPQQGNIHQGSDLGKTSPATDTDKGDMGKQGSMQEALADEEGYMSMDENEQEDGTITPDE